MRGHLYRSMHTSIPTTNSHSTTILLVPYSNSNQYNQIYTLFYYLYTHSLPINAYPRNYTKYLYQRYHRIYHSWIRLVIPMSAFQNSPTHFRNNRIRKLYPYSSYQMDPIRRDVFPHRSNKLVYQRNRFLYTLFLGSM